MCKIIAPGQNRTDARSLEGYSSTIELQAHRMSHIINKLLFYAREILRKTINFLR